jgi:hypothetical protein
VQGPLLAGVISVPVIAADGTVLLNTPSTLIALNPDDTTKLSRPNDGADGGYLVVQKDGTFVVGSSTGRVFAKDGDGVVQWAAKLPGSTQSNPLAIATNGTVYVPSTQEHSTLHGTAAPAQSIGQCSSTTYGARDGPILPCACPCLLRRQDSPAKRSDIGAAHTAERTACRWLRVWRGADDDRAGLASLKSRISADNNVMAGVTNFIGSKQSTVPAQRLQCFGRGFRTRAGAGGQPLGAMVAPGQALRTRR